MPFVRGLRPKKKTDNKEAKVLTVDRWAEHDVVRQEGGRGSQPLEHLSYNKKERS